MAAYLLTLLSVTHLMGGLASFDQTRFYEIPATGQGMTRHDITGWAVAHLALGGLLLLAALGAAIGRSWIRPAGMALALLSAAASAFFLAYQPFWALVIVGLDVAVIVVLLRQPGRRTRRRRRPRHRVAAHR